MSGIAPAQGEVWRCSVCKKVKDLKGPHLRGKNSVRSDCWPCAKKQTFLRDQPPTTAPQSGPTTTAAAPAAANPFDAVFARMRTKTEPSSASVAAPQPASLNPFGGKTGAQPVVAESPFKAVIPTPFPNTTTTTTVAGSTAAAPAAGSAVDGISAVPSTEAQAAAFQNILAAAKAAAATAAAKAPATTAAGVFGVSPPTATSFPLSSTTREGSTGTGGGGGGGASAASAAAPTSATAFGMPRSQSNPFLTPAVSAASIKKFQTSYASVMSGSTTTTNANRHEDPAAAQEMAKSATSTTSTAATVFTPSSTSSPYVMEASAGTSPPFTFRPNANYNPSAAAAAAAAVTGGGTGGWPTSVLLPGSTATTAAAAPGPFTGRTPSPFSASLTATRGDSVGEEGSATAFQVGAAGGSARGCIATPDKSTSATAPAAAALAAAGLGVNSVSAASGGACVWMCEQCHKVKDLKGDHLRGKTTVRSDCWPCAKKRTFVLTTPGEMAALHRSLKLGSGSATGSRSSSAALRASMGNDGGRNSSVRGAQAAAIVGGSAAQPRANPFAVRAAAPSSVSAAPPAPLPKDGAGARTAFSWATPAIPSDAAHTEGRLLLQPGANLPSGSSVQASAGAGSVGGVGGASLPAPLTTAAASASPSHSAAVAVSASSSFIAAVTTEGEADAATYYAAMARFDQQLLKTFRERLVGGVQLRAVWHHRVLYVIAAEDESSDDQQGRQQRTRDGQPESGTAAAKSDEPADLLGAFAELGRFAALYLAVEQKLAGSRFRHIGRLFCPDEFSFAAACCYATNFFGAESTTSPLSSPPATTTAAAASATTTKFPVYGPQADPTKALTLWGRIIAQSPVAQLCVVSEEQRVAAAQTLYRRVSWLAAPQTMTATAIQLNVENEGAAADVHGVDVVLLTGTMKLEDLPQAVPLAQLSKTFV